MNRYTKSFILTLVLYLAIFGSFLYSTEEEKQLKSSQKKSEQVVKFTIIQESIPIEKKKESVVKKKTITKQKEIKRIVKKKPVTKKLQPKVEQKKKKALVKKKETNVVKKVIKPKQTIVKKQIVQIKQNKSNVKNTVNHQDILKKHKEQQNKYYTQIKETINKNKSYPKMAIKRGIEGIVKIEFTISQYGELLSFNIIEGKRVFKKSITTAVKNSFPLTPPKDVLTSKTSLSLQIDYRLY